MAEEQVISNESQTGDLAFRYEQLAQEIRRRIDQLTAINTIAVAISQSLDLDATLQTALDVTLAVIKVDAAGISLVDKAAGELVLRAQRGWKHDFVTRPMRIPLGHGMSGQAVRNDEIVITGDVSTDPRLAVPEFAQEGVQSMVLVPMHARGEVVGVLSTMHYAPYSFSEGEITMLSVIADQIGVALDNARLYESVKEQSSRLQAVLQSSGDAIIATDSRGYINLFNAMAERLFAIPAEEIVGLPLREAPLHPRLRASLQHAMLNPSEGSHTAFELPLETGRVVSVIVSPVYATPAELDSTLPAEGWVLVMSDVTHLKEADQSRAHFLHAAAHDLRSPLSAMLSALVMLQADLGGSEQHGEIINIGLQSVDRMQQLIDNLLNLEHIESGLGFQTRLVDPRDLIERCIVDITPHTAQREQRLLFEVPPDLPAILGDMHWLQRALINLLNNASKYTQPGGEITLRAYTRLAELYLEVQDNGPGIPAEAQARLFERFYRVPNTAQSTKGSGLGLAIVKSVVEQHGGRVFVQSWPGRGSIFGMVLPLIAEDTSH